MVCVSMLGYIRSLLGVYEFCQAEWCVDVCEDRGIVVEGRWRGLMQRVSRRGGWTLRVRHGN